MKDNKINDNFSVALGLTDYINPIMYLITSITLIINITIRAIHKGSVIPSYTLGIIFIAHTNSKRISAKESNLAPNSD